MWNGSGAKRPELDPMRAHYIRKLERSSHLLAWKLSPVVFYRLLALRNTTWLSFQANVTEAWKLSPVVFCHKLALRNTTWLSFQPNNICLQITDESQYGSILNGDPITWKWIHLNPKSSSRNKSGPSIAIAIEINNSSSNSLFVCFFQLLWLLK